MSLPQRTLQQLQRLHPRTPAPAIHFLSGSLPAAALLHIHMFTLLHMVAKLGPTSILFQHSIYILHHCIPNSWFTALHLLSPKYHLTDPLQILVYPPLKKPFKKAVKSSVRESWHSSLLAQAASMPSLPPSGSGAAPSLVDLPLLTQCCQGCDSPGQDAEWKIPILLASAPLVW